MTERSPRSAFPPTAYGESYPSATFPRTPTDRASSIFPYSTVRPPTNYSAQSWVAPRNAPAHAHVPLISARPYRGSGASQASLVSRSDSDSSTDSSETSGSEGGDSRETPLYARSDWGESEYPATAGGRGSRRWSAGSPSRRDSGRWKEEKTAWTQSSWFGPRTGELHQIREEDEDEEAEGSGESHVHSEGYDGYEEVDLDEGRREQEEGYCWTGDMVASPMSLPAKSMTSRPQSSFVQLSHDHQPLKDASRRMTIPSVLSLGQLLGKPPSAPNRMPTNPFDDPPSHLIQETRAGPALRHSYTAQATPGGPLSQSPSDTSGAELMSPEAQQRLGRMSVAKPRYSIPALGHVGRSRSKGMASVVSQPRGGAGIKHSGLGRVYRIYRPFVRVGITTLAAMLVTVAVSTGKTLGGFVKLQQGALAVMPVQGDVTLGVTEWCATSSTGTTCKGYSEGDFINSAATFRIPANDSLLSTLSGLMTALTALLWLLSSFQLVTAFLHSVLFFGLSIPLDHLVEASNPTTAQNGQVNPLGEKSPEDKSSFPERGVDPVQVEVDLRARCERPPYESYHWVWWAWWAHRRGPLGEVFAAATAIMGICTLTVTVSFERQVASAADVEGDVSLGIGTFVPLLVLLLIADSIYGSALYWLHSRSSLHTFLSPPDPAPTAVLLPYLSPVRRTFHSTTGSFFAPRTTLPPTTDSPLFVADPDLIPDSHAPTPPNPILDPETVRWLAAYPSDPKLVPLIAFLRGGRENDDFVLSDVGLLYLKPEDAELGGNALLVPPCGIIRQELIEDAHLEGAQSGGSESGGSANGHWAPGVMLRNMADTFWWPTMESDVEAAVDRCAICQRDGIPANALGHAESVGAAQPPASEIKLGMTPVPFTGVTGWTGLQTGWEGKGGEGRSAMAAEMAVAMRKADEEAAYVLG